MLSKRKASSAILVAALTFSLMTSGCYGPFRLTKKVHSWNASVSEDKWVQELVFLGLIFLPVYSFASLGDAVVFNSIEFWTGDNPIDDGGNGSAEASEAAPEGSGANGGAAALGNVRVLRKGDLKLTLERLDAGRMRVTVERGSELVEDSILVANGANSWLKTTIDGDVVSRATIDGDAVLVRDEATGDVERLDREALTR
ncbi:MAG: DUF3332 family protein [Planctomycetota bacterium]